MDWLLWLLIAVVLGGAWFNSARQHRIRNAPAQSFDSLTHIGEQYQPTRKRPVQ